MVGKISEKIEEQLELEKPGDRGHRKTEEEKTTKEVFGHINAPQRSDKREQKLSPY